MLSGQRVLCINTDFRNYSGFEVPVHRPKKGGIYVIEDTGGFDEVLYLMLPSYDGWWRADNFRPITDRPTDISIFHEIRIGVRAPPLEVCTVK